MGTLIHAQGLVDVVNARVDVFEAFDETLVALLLDLEESVPSLLGRLSGPVVHIRGPLSHLSDLVELLEPTTLALACHVPALCPVGPYAS